LIKGEHHGPLSQMKFFKSDQEINRLDSKEITNMRFLR